MSNDAMISRKIVQWIVRMLISGIYEIAVAVTRPLMNQLLLHYPLLTEQQFLLECIGSWAVMLPIVMWCITLGQVSLGSLTFFSLVGGALGWRVGNRLIHEWLPLPPPLSDPTKSWGIPQSALEVDPTEEAVPAAETSQDGLLLGKQVPHWLHRRDL